MKRLRNVLLTVAVIAMVFCIASVQSFAAEEKTYGDFTYTVTDGKVTITGYTGTSYDAEIPSAIGGKPVTTIGKWAFDRCEIKSITIPDSVTKFEEFAFADCTMLERVNVSSLAEWCSIDIVDSVSNPLYFNAALYVDGKKVTDLVIPESVTRIKSCTFMSCDSIETVTIPSTVKVIEDYAFYWCKGLKSVTIEKGLTAIPAGAFADCAALQKINLPDSIVTINDSAFSGCSSLKEIKIPDSVTSLGANAFRNCASLKSITVPEKVKSVGADAFSYCTALTDIYWNAQAVNDFDYSYEIFTGSGNKSKGVNITFGETAKVIPEYFCGGQSGKGFSVNVVKFEGKGLTRIGWDAFIACSKIKKLEIADIGHWNSVVFSGYYSNPLCKGGDLYVNGEKQTKLEIPEGVKRISAFAFYNLNGITEVTLPKSLESIGESFLSENTKLEKVHIKDLERWLYIDFMHETANPLRLGADLYVNGKKVTEVVTPDGITKLNNFVFFGYKSLESVELSDGVTRIGDYAFCGCFNLKDIDIASTVSEIGGNAFDGCRLLESVRIPYSVTLIEGSAFKDCEGIKDVYCHLEETEFAGIVVEYENDYLLNAEIHYLCPHNETKNTEAVAPTCSSLGYTAGVHCSKCLEFISGHKEIAKNTSNHINTKQVAEVPATIESVGYTAGVYCNDCKKYISGHEEIPVLCMPGDIDADGVISAADARLALRAAVGLESFDEAKKKTSDADCDGSITASDARMILRASVGLEDPKKWLNK